MPSRFQESPSQTLPEAMFAMRIHCISKVSDHTESLHLDRVPLPVPAPHEVLIKVKACAVCHTELDEIEGRTPPLEFPMTPGHQVVGQVVETGSGCDRNLAGGNVGVAWIYSSCGKCDYCCNGQENLCPNFVASGRDAHGGYAQYMVADGDYIHHLPEGLDAASTAPLLCAGSVGFRALTLCQINDGQALGLTGFGASGHLVLQMARYLYPASSISVYARNPTEQDFARQLGADWAGDTEDQAPFPAAAIIDTTPAWKPVRNALSQLQPGGRLVINAIRKEDTDKEELLALDYEKHLWHEKSIHSVANVSRNDVRKCLELAAEMNLTPDISTYPMRQANTALQELKRGGQPGAKVLIME
jgi:propanol-preferring alcohol dehydrogenase